MGMVWLIFQVKHLEGKDRPIGLRFDASNLETHSRNSLRGNIHKKGGTRFPVLPWPVHLRVDIIMYYSSINFV